jgi:putative CocE/NonD family hydrolase
MRILLSTSLTLATLAAAPLAVAQRNSWPPPPVKSEVALEFGVPVSLRDGVTARISVYRPAAQRDPLPVILLITPYQADAFHPTAMYFAQRGYVVATADTRGRGHTDGDWKPFVQDGPMGYDLVEWLAKQPYCDGKVGMIGISYLGFTQWTTLKEFPPHLATIVPTAAGYFSYTSLHPHNIFSTYAIRWLSGVSGRSLNGQLNGDTEYWNGVLWRWYSKHLPYAVLDSVAGNRTTELATWIKHPALDDYVEATVPKIEDYRRIDIPILTVSGHFDSEQRAALRYYRRHLRHGNDAAKAKHHLIIGPWDHLATFWPRATIEGLTFDRASVVDLGTVHTQWYDWTLKGGPKPGFLKNRVAYYLIGAEEWRYAADLEGVTGGTRLYHLGSPGENPTQLRHAGTLTAEPAGVAEPPDRWVYDPLDTRPGALELRTPAGKVGPADSLELFGAGLVYQTAPLTEPLDLAGQVRLRLWLSMDVPDTDFSATLFEVTRDGRAIYLTRQLQRARYREGLERERLVTPGEITPFVLDDFDFFARRIASGSRIRLVVGALNSLGFEKNYNAGGVVAHQSGKDARTARVNLHHDASRPSALELPIAAVSRLAQGH